MELQFASASTGLHLFCTALPNLYLLAGWLDGWQREGNKTFCNLLFWLCSIDRANERTNDDDDDLLSFNYSNFKWHLFLFASFHTIDQKKKQKKEKDEDELNK